MQRDSGRNKADVDFSSQFPEHLPVIGEEGTADAAQPGAFLRFFRLIDDSGADRPDTARGVLSYEVLIMNRSEAGDADDCSIEHLFSPEYLPEFR